MPPSPGRRSYEALEEERGVKYAIRLPAHRSLEMGIAELLTRLVDRPRHQENALRMFGSLGC